mmetsp:Transcript_7036/g.27023  ORF Transcript_7036/g.27023 Transcript_7036/m.27023 type:complete len:520 (-) Transcript_7036:107-1666(-)
MRSLVPLLLLCIALATAKRPPKPEAAPLPPAEATDASHSEALVGSESRAQGKNRLVRLLENVGAHLSATSAFLERHKHSLEVVLLASAVGVFVTSLWRVGADIDREYEKEVAGLQGRQDGRMLSQRQGTDEFLEDEPYDADEEQSESTGERRITYTREEKGLLACVVDVKNLVTTFDDIGGLEDEKLLLEELVVHPMQQADAPSNPWTGHPLLRPPTGILLYGPPGCGKTMLVRAAAKEAGVTLLQITPAFIESKWFGESAQKVSALFSLARKLQPCIIYIDEVDALCLERNVESVNRDLKSELLQQWDGLQGVKGDRIIIVGSTNALKDIDAAFQRRFARCIPIPYPSYPERIKVLKKVLAGVALDAKLRLEAVAAGTDGYSSSDLEELARAALNRAVREMRERMRITAKMNAARQKETPKVQMDYATLRPLTLSDFEAALDEALPTKFHGVDDVDLRDVLSPSSAPTPTANNYGSDDDWMDEQFVEPEVARQPSENRPEEDRMGYSTGPDSESFPFP